MPKKNTVPLNIARDLLAIKNLDSNFKALKEANDYFQTYIEGRTLRQIYDESNCCKYEHVILYDIFSDIEEIQMRYLISDVAVREILCTNKYICSNKTYFFISINLENEYNLQPIALILEKYNNSFLRRIETCNLKDLPPLEKDTDFVPVTIGHIMDELYCTPTNS